MMRDNCSAVRPLSVLPKRIEEPETKVPEIVRVPVQGMVLLSEKVRAAPVPRWMLALPVTSSVPTVSVNVAASSLAVAKVIALLGSALLSPKARVPAWMIVGPA